VAVRAAVGTQKVVADYDNWSSSLGCSTLVVGPHVRNSQTLFLIFDAEWTVVHALISLGKLALSDVLLSHVDSLLVKRAIIGQVMSLIELVDGNRL